ncbi:unnamed protein product [Cladocopium goreaui]|uniref:PDZ domain-containing protein n=1 Tax=Cladocopium goreaui TaxID=2562237 RepID=A0A9P1M607_9DINO|nr:unnamed protein product [Cladocopium goreaui]
MRRRRSCHLAKIGKVTILLQLCLLALCSIYEAPAQLFLNRGNKQKVLLQARGYELVMFPSKGKVPIPTLKFRKIPLKPLTLMVSGSTDGSLDKSALTGFPYSTDNAASLLLGFPRLGGQLSLGMDAPAVNSDSDDSNHLEAAYEQRLPGGGRVAARLRSNGEWGASFRHEVEDMGTVSGGLNSQLDWNLDLNTSYAPVRGFTPSVAYGATQDGVHLRGRVDKDFSPHWHGSYGLQNIPGKYSPVDFVHDSTITLSAGRHTIQASAAYDRQMLKSPLTGAISYTLTTRPVTLHALMDGSQYALAAQSGRKSLAATLGRPNEEGQRSSQVELRFGQVAATMKKEGSSKPRIRLSKDAVL